MERHGLRGLCCWLDLQLGATTVCSLPMTTPLTHTHACPSGLSFRKQPGDPLKNPELNMLRVKTHQGLPLAVRITCLPPTMSLAFEALGKFLHPHDPSLCSQTFLRLPILLVLRSLCLPFPLPAMLCPLNSHAALRPLWPALPSAACCDYLVLLEDATTVAGNRPLLGLTLTLCFSSLTVSLEVGGGEDG